MLILVPFLVPNADAAGGTVYGPPAPRAAASGAATPVGDDRTVCLNNFRNDIKWCRENFCPDPSSPGCDEIGYQACLDG